MKIGQKDAVVKAVLEALPNFVKHKDIALVMLSKNQLEEIKNVIGRKIVAGDIEYSKDSTKIAEVHAYARSMVMNHLKKAKELNGNAVYAAGAVTKATTPIAAKHCAINIDILTDELREYVKSL